jgi:hypothetical protein
MKDWLADVVAIACILLVFFGLILSVCRDPFANRIECRPRSWVKAAIHWVVP